MRLYDLIRINIIYIIQVYKQANIYINILYKYIVHEQMCDEQTHSDETFENITLSFIRSEYD